MFLEAKSENKKNNKKIIITWELIAKAKPFREKGSKYNLCLSEKLMILKNIKNPNLNKRSLHRSKFLFNHVVPKWIRYYITTLNPLYLIKSFIMTLPRPLACCRKPTLFISLNVLREIVFPTVNIYVEHTITTLSYWIIRPTSLNIYKNILVHIRNSGKSLSKIPPYIFTKRINTN